ncbi:TetR family transcriptional regulator [Stackebrandtia endophytica]|uniref:TetR family transcriptional regulator n=1 Tax=Stackebrandtia endophytica TaxID=1496996 RepID=A0A543AVB4_9ACTN|nr:TetR/AcrR family transcriptional regulator [Stackebrandtia endophytica]TQL76507.1 TetR family transcriptional regulator [Stackebrandtia endophytica]
MDGDGKDSAPGRPARADARRNRARILAAAEAVFAQQGASASTEGVAKHAGVAIGTVFRHFPTKLDLLKAVVMNLQDRLVAEADDMVNDSEDGTDLLEFCGRVLETGVQNRAVFARLAETGVRVRVGDALQGLRPSIAQLLDRAQQAGAVRDDLDVAELIALLAAFCQEAMTEGWSAEFRQRALKILFEGMRPL